MRVTVCELRNDAKGREQDWQVLRAHVEAAASDLVLLPEMPFYEWLPRSRQVDPAAWRRAVAAHDQWQQRLTELAPAVVLGSRPVIANGQRFNEAFIWQPAVGYQSCRRKYYLPDERGFWEASWYRRGDKDFAAAACKGLKLGFLICTELWFSTHARAYGRQGLHLLVCPRATPERSVNKWIAGGIAAAVVSGAYCLSSNLSGPNVAGIDFGGTGWIIDPEEGDVLGLTSREAPFLTVDIDPAVAESAKHTYPRYVQD